MTTSSEAPSASAITGALQTRFGDSVLETTDFRGQFSAVITPATLLDALRFLRDEHQLSHCSDITAVDWLERSPRFDVVYHLYSFTSHLWYRLKIRTNADQAVPSATPVFPNADWAEREIFDLFGLIFSDHPNLTRILMPDDWVGYPLRKDYPISQITLPRAGTTKIPE